MLYFIHKKDKQLVFTEETNMKNTKKGRMAASILSALLCAGLALFSAGCGSDSDSSESGSGVNEVEQDSSKGITSVALDKTTLSLLTGTTAELTATVETTSGDIAKTVTWTSSDESVATVSDGTVTAVAAGSATITAASTVDTTKKATCSVTVESANSSEVLWRADEYEAQTCSDNQTLGIMTVIVGGGSVLVDENSKSIDGYSFTKRLKFGGSGSTSKNSIKFTTTDSATITVYFISGSSGNSRTLNLYDGTDVVASGTNDGTAIASFSTTSAVAAGTYYIYSAGSGINVYAVKIAYESAQNIVYPSAVSLSASTLSLDVSDDSTTKTATLTATIANASEVTSGKDTIEWTSSNTSVATVSNGVVTAKKAGTATITASCVYGGKSAICEVTVTGTSSGKTISASDTPTGWASYIGTTYFDGTTGNSPADSTKGTSGGYGAASSKIYTVSTKSELTSALSGIDKKIIYVNGMIDLSEGMLPTSASESSTALDSWIATEAANLTGSSYGTVSTEVTNLATWKTWYASGCTNTADESGVYAAARSKLSSNYGNKIKIKVPSNTTIIGLDSDCGFKGGSVQIVGATNVVIRNLVVQDAFDPFPQIQDGDGFNAEWDAIVVQGSSYVWIDHCTLQDTIAVTDDDFDHVKLSDNVEKKYQVFDGLIDVKGNSSGSVPSDFVTISYCKIANHDKVGIIGHSDSSDAYDANHLTVTLHNNYYLNCTQRLPRVRFGHVHVFNNYYQNDGEGRSNSYCFGVGKNAYIYAEKNYFGDKINYVATMMSSSKPGYITLVDNAGVSKLDGVTSTTTWTPSNYYSYEAVSADDSLVEDVIENAGAGVCTVVQ